ncbi:response regulator [Spirosoma sp. KNUC1025]|uniref:response regulator n=1 Tax=Spirosoma sp. KNUC1025 TaxID=2894082 RepID=UPI003867F78B|nr:response regulator [Spirosoma sp. KNUC1025]
MNDQSFEILVVDDDPMIFDLFNRIGQQLFTEATFTWVSSPQESLQYLNRQSTRLPSLVLLDIDFQVGMNGISWLPELYNRLRGQAPIIMLSISNAANDIQQAYMAGAVAYTQKPQELQGWKNYVEVLKNIGIKPAFFRRQ